MGERISDSCVRPVVTFSVYLSPLPYTHGPYDHILSIKENHTGKNSKPIPATAAYLSYLLVRPSFASSDRNLLCPPIPSPAPRISIPFMAPGVMVGGKEPQRYPRGQAQPYPSHFLIIGSPLGHESRICVRQSSPYRRTPALAMRGGKGVSGRGLGCSWFD